MLGVMGDVTEHVRELEQRIARQEALYATRGARADGARYEQSSDRRAAEDRSLDGRRPREQRAGQIGRDLAQRGRGPGRDASPGDLTRPKTPPRTSAILRFPSDS